MNTNDLNCEFCNDRIIGIPIVLTCGFQVCMAHLHSQLQKIQCFICKTHEINIKECLDMPKNKLKITQMMSQEDRIKYIKQHESIKNELNKKIEDFKLIQLNPDSYLDAINQTLKRKFEFRRNELMKQFENKLNAYYSQLFDKVKLIQNKQLENFNNKMLSINIEEIENSNKTISNETDLDVLKKKLKDIENFSKKIQSFKKEFNQMKNFDFYYDENEHHFKNNFDHLIYEPNLSDSIQGKCTTLEDHEKGVFCLEIKGEEIVSGSWDKTIKIWTKSNGRLKNTLIGHLDAVSCLKVLHSGEIISGSWDKTIKVWSNDICLKTLQGHNDIVNCLEIINKLEIISGSDDETLKVWNVDTGKCTNTFYGHLDGVVCVLVLDNERIASGSFDKMIKIWNKNGTCLNTLNGHFETINCLQKSNDLLISGSGDGNIKFWDIQTKNCVKTIIGHDDSVTCLKSLDSNELISGSADKTIKIWDLKQGKCVKTLHGHGNTIWCLEVFKNKEIISGSLDKKIKIWT